MGDIEREAIAVRVIGEIGNVAARDWDACAGTENPFVRHAFLSALERSGSARAETGWAPYHIVIDDPAGGLKGAVPMYIKGHSQGEYVFDYAWAHAYERAGGQYYPKVQVSVPFTPVNGPRLLARPGPDRERIADALAAGCIAVVRQLELSSVHVTFCTKGDARALAAQGFLLRNDQQFHWENRGFASFDDFLQSLTSRKRKTIRRERREALADGVQIEVLCGPDLREEHWDAFYHFYIDTGGRKWGAPYLSRTFFSMLGEGCADDVVLILCRRAGRYIAGALNLKGTEALYGRNWGCIEDHRFLHFEACYYQAIDYAISHGLKRVEAGAQGQHKLARGYVPIKTTSAHWVRDPGFRQALEDYLGRERREVDFEISYLSGFAPFKKDPQKQK